MEIDTFEWLATRGGDPRVHNDWIIRSGTLFFDTLKEFGCICRDTPYNTSYTIYIFSMELDRDDQSPGPAARPRV